MSFDDDTYVSTAELIRRDAADRAREQWEDYQEQRLLESVEGREQHWTGVMRQMPEHVRRTHFGSDVTS